MLEFAPICIYLAISLLVSLILLGVPFLFASNSSTYPEKMKGIGAKLIGAGAATIALAGAAIGIVNMFSSYSLGLGARPKFADIQNGYQAAAFLFADPLFLIFVFFTLALLLLYFWGTVQQREAALESILSKNTELGAAHKFSYGWAGVSLKPVFGCFSCNETPIKKRGEGRTESE